MDSHFLWNHAENAEVFDTRARRFIDFTSGIFACNTGFGNRRVEARIRYELSTKGTHSYTYSSDIRSWYEKSLTEWCGYEGVHLFTTGSEAIEGALRLVRGYSKRSKRIWGIAGSFHGKTLFSTLPDRYGSWIQVESILDGHVKYAKKRPAGIIVEGYRGWDRLFWSDAVINWLRMWQERGALIIFDEVQSGFGRTGRRFAYEWYEPLVPDILVIGKGSHSGFPGSAVVASRELLAPWKEDFSSTHGGGPLACAAGLATIEEFERLDLVKEAERKGKVLHEYLKQNTSVPCTGRGLVAAILTDSRAEADKIVTLCRNRGLLVVHTGKSSVKLGPPLTIPDEVLLEGLEILGTILQQKT